MEEEEKKNGSKLIEATGDIIETYRNLVTVRLVQNTSMGGAAGAVGIIYMIFLSFIMLFTGLGIAWWVGEAMHNVKAGFFIVGGFFLLLFIIVLLCSKKVLIPGIRNFIIRKIYEFD